MRFLELAFNRAIVRRSLIVAIVVGTILNLINQGEALFEPQSIEILKCLLTYLVPYCVSTYGAVSALMEQEKTDSSKQ